MSKVWVEANPYLVQLPAAWLSGARTKPLSFHTYSWAPRAVSLGPVGTSPWKMSTSSDPSLLKSTIRTPRSQPAWFAPGHGLQLVMGGT
jgi:hypothetical protein